MTLHKDAALDQLAEIGNVAQFVAFRPGLDRGLQQSFARLIGREPNVRFQSIPEAIASLLETSSDGAINIRSYLPDDPRSREFVYGLKSAEDALNHVERLGQEGLHLIVNETVDVSDGGVSGVAHGSIIEFAPDDTPRAVEKPGIASFPREMGLGLLRTIYGFVPEMPDDPTYRVEFSIHPRPRGWRHTNTLLWEIESAVGASAAPPPRWPNRFSQFLGDKAFGLLIADALGVPVPATTVVSRRVAPFRFGCPTNSGETWIRTCPREPQPGLFTTARGWRDPFALIAAEDPDGQIASVLSQDGVVPVWSGAALVGAGDALIIEGRGGTGDSLMLGESQPEALPDHTVEQVKSVHGALSQRLGPVRIEWVHDGDKVWIVQLHVGKTQTSELALVEGSADRWFAFNIAEGLPALRALLPTLPTGVGLELKGNVGLTSHIADLVRKWGRPARIVHE